MKKLGTECNAFQLCGGHTPTLTAILTLSVDFDVSPSRSSIPPVPPPPSLLSRRELPPSVFKVDALQRCVGDEFRFPLIGDAVIKYMA